MITTMSFLEMSFYGGIFIIAITILRALASHRLPKYAMLALWLAALLRLAVPLTIASPVSIYSAATHLTQTPLWQPDRSPHSLNTGELSGIASRAASAQTTAAAGSGSLLETPALLPIRLADLFTIIWISVALLTALGFLISHLRGTRIYKTSLPLDHPFIQQWMSGHRLRRQVQVRICDQIDSPLTYGIIRPVILLPKRGYNNEQLSFILAHELAHIRRFDTLTKWSLAAIVCIHWFNPMVWVMYILANRDLELSCDDYVIRLHGRETRATYALTLVSLEEHRAHCSPLSNSFCKNAMKERITAIMKSKKTTAVSTAAALLLVAVSVSLFWPAGTANSNQAMAAGNQNNTAATHIDAVQEGLTEDSSTNDSPYTTDDYLKFDQKKYDKLIAALKFQNYESMSIAEFNRKVNALLGMHDTYSGNEADEYLMELYEIVLNTLPDNDPNEFFLQTTVRASMEEYSARLTEVYTKKATDPQYYAMTYISQESDVFGDKVTVKYGSMDYSFTYKILDQNKLTVAERDKFLSDIDTGINTSILSAKFTGDDDKDKNTAQKLLETIGKSASNDRISFTGCEIHDLDLNIEGGEIL